MITIYGSPRSSSGRCFWCLEEVGETYNAKPLNFKEKEHKSPAYLKINPNGKAPTLTDDDFVIWESIAINFYLAETYKPELLGLDNKNYLVGEDFTLADINAASIASLCSEIKFDLTTIRNFVRTCQLGLKELLRSLKWYCQIKYLQKIWKLDFMNHSKQVINCAT